MVDIERVSSQSMDIENADLEKLRAVFPQCFSEGKLDISKLLALFGQYDDNDFEKYKFEWKGKSECYRIAGKRSTGTLRPCPEESVNFDTTNNIYIEGDNLEVLKLLQSSYYNKVKMIYIDPPYNTGNDFVYEDDFKDPMTKYKEVTQQTTKSNPETMGRFHTNWLNMMYPRLRLAANLLRDDGVIFISIDETELHNLKKICDEVFGEENFVADFVWHNKRGGGNDAKFVAVEHEYVIMYAKNVHELAELFVPFSPQYLLRYKEEDEIGKYYWDTFKRKSGKQYYPITCPDGSVLQYDELGNPISWLRSEARFKEDLSKGEVRIVKIKDNWSVQFKQRLPEGKKPRTIFLEESIFENQGTTADGSGETLELFCKNVFDNPKPTALIKHLLSFNTSNNDIILDFFAGSGTTADAVMQLNKEDNSKRQFIMVQLPALINPENKNSKTAKGAYEFLQELKRKNNLCEVSKERIRRAGKKLTENNGQLALEEKKPLDIGFKVFKLDTSNLAKWDSSPLENAGALFQRLDAIENSIKSDRTDLDVVYEVMLKLGIPLDYKVIPIEINDKKAYSIGEDCLVLVCLDYGKDGITPEDIEAMCELVPAKIVSSEQAFKDDTALSNAHYILKDKGIEMKLL
ncbi:site-specific DNA-methyltransferase (Adenine-specific) [Fusobacterium sp. CAG:439]|nr:site-specific DNA-methyltransferase (Adenine-specific) [Fusobacterium sp. CAG:439]